MHWLIYLAPINAVGYDIANLSVGPFILAFVVVFLLSIFRSPISVTSLIIVIGYVSFLFSITFYRSSPSEFLPALSAVAVWLFLMLQMSERCFNYNERTVRELAQRLVSFTYLIGVLVLIELALGVYWPNQIEVLLERITPRGQSNMYFGIRRARLFMHEPSELALFLLAVSAMLITLRPYVRRPILLLVLLSASVLATMSLVGILGMTLIWMWMVLFPNVGNSTFAGFKRSALILLCFIVVGLLAPDPIFLKLEGKVVAVWQSLVEGKFSSSAGIRVGSLVYLLEFLLTQSDEIKLFGLGFSSYEGFLQAEFSLFPDTAFFEGNPGNMINAIGFGTGAVGLVFFGLVLIWVNRRSDRTSVGLRFLLLSLVMLGYGNMVSPFFWLLVFMIALSFRATSKLRKAI